MQVKGKTQSGLPAEIKIVPAWAWALAGIAFVAAQWYFNIEIERHAGAPPAWCRPLLGLLAGVGGGCYLLFVGYINRDAKRRGMSPTLWTLVSILIPNGLGVLLYFVLRQPRRSSCPQCGSAVQAGFNFCPCCNHKLSPSCPHCQRGVSANDIYCPYCGTSLRGQAPSQLATSLPG